MSSSAFFIEAAAKTVMVLSCADAGEWATPSRTTKAVKIPARRDMRALRACLRTEQMARATGVGWVRDATGGSAVPAIQTTYGRLGYRQPGTYQADGPGKGDRLSIWRL